MTEPNTSGNSVHTPPPFFENLVRLLTPRIRRRDLIDELREEFESKPQPAHYAGHSARTLARLIPGTILTAFNAALMMAQAAALLMSFSGAAVTTALAFGIGIGVLVLIIRDGYTFPSETPVEAITGAALAAIFVILSQVLIAQMARLPVLPQDVMLRGGIASLLSLSLLRMIFRRPDYNKEYSPRELSNQWYQMACRVNVIWVIAYLVFTFSNADSKPSRVDSFVGAAWILIIGMSFKSRWQGMSRPKKDDYLSRTIRPDHEKLELKRRLSLLWTPKTLIPEVLFFSLIALQCIAAVFQSPTMDWIRFGTNVTASFMLAMVWRYIRKANAVAAQLLQSEIDKLEVAQ